MHYRLQKRGFTPTPVLIHEEKMRRALEKFVNDPSNRIFYIDRGVFINEYGVADTDRKLYIMGDLGETTHIECASTYHRTYD